MRKTLVALCASAAMLIGFVGVTPQAAEARVLSAQGCGSSADFDFPDITQIFNLQVPLPEVKFACVVSLNQWSLGFVDLPIGITVAGQATMDVLIDIDLNLNINPFDPDFGINPDVNNSEFNGSAAACLIAYSIQSSTANPGDWASFRCLALQSTISNGAVANGSWIPRFVQPAFVMDEANNTVNGMEPFDLGPDEEPCIPIPLFPDLCTGLTGLLESIITPVISAILPGGLDLLTNVSINVQS